MIPCVALCHWRASFARNPLLCIALSSSFLYGTECWHILAAGTESSSSCRGALPVSHLPHPLLLPLWVAPGSSSGMPCPFSCQVLPYRLCCDSLHSPSSSLGVLRPSWSLRISYCDYVSVSQNEKSHFVLPRRLPSGGLTIGL